MTIVLAGIILIAQFANAQIPNTIQGVELKLSTDSPSPGQNIKVSAESYTADLNSSEITWTLDKKTYIKGIGKTSIDVQAPLLGEKLTVGITAVTADGKTLSNSITINSGSVDLILETNGYVPPFFQGKAPFVYENEYRIVAIPHLANSNGSEYNPNDLVYQWTKDSRVIQDQSGYGKQVFSWKEESVPRDRLILVKVSSRDGSAQAQKLMTLRAGNPWLSFYVDDPLYGTLYNNAIGNEFSLGISGETAVLAVPFGFSVNENGDVSELNYNWLLNGSKQEALAHNRSVTLRAPQNQSGSSDINLTITSVGDFLQKISSAITINFNNPSDQQNGNSPSNYNGL